MNILILGCSFGVPDNGCPAEFHTENQLRILGHTVYNCAKQGASNLESLEIAEKFLLQEPHDIDLVIWFHTELVRDSSYVEGNLEHIAETVYSKFKIFLSVINAKSAIIGGAGPVHPLLYNYITPDFCIPSWFNEILNLDLPQIQTLSRLDIVEKMQSVGIQTKFEILQQHEEILNALEASSDFPDNYHPGARPHQELAERLHKIFTR